ncbi:MAG: hypothetical protein EOO35_00520 [Cyanobacteriota bacterium]|nr:MAG: hypothetical protein EOO35_00520 [Cyanobacteriota bacterium]
MAGAIPTFLGNVPGNVTHFFRENAGPITAIVAAQTALEHANSVERKAAQTNRSSLTGKKITPLQYLHNASECRQSLASVNEDLRDQGYLREDQIVGTVGFFNDQRYVMMNKDKNVIEDRNTFLAKANRMSQNQSKEEGKKISKTKKTAQSKGKGKEGTSSNDPMASISLSSNTRNNWSYNNLFEISSSDNALQNEQAIQEGSYGSLENSHSHNDVGFRALENGAVIASSPAPLPKVVGTYGSLCLGLVVATVAFSLSKKLRVEIEKRLGLVTHSTDQKNVDRNVDTNVDKNFSRSMEIYKQYNEKKLTTFQAQDSLKRFCGFTDPDPDIEKGLFDKLLTN